jgi:hypothetical protein
LRAAGQQQRHSQHCSAGSPKGYPPKRVHRPRRETLRASRPTTNYGCGSDGFTSLCHFHSK